ncbi:BtpA/SgcQ family protein [[Collinsella] massiliensis]|uniref:Membrane biogenesis protein n=1 Tax=[Collinsella] massiliensis TaxID=1232426 RepID=A0A1Y3XV63_9ACTN|nr:BtpA/SgcQ family protein [[Collinsella] massiliensis]OUN85940.1 membrane biogenesis protein [[Collinsella] massiliensis]
MPEAEKSRFLSLFRERKPVMAMLHLKGSDPDDVFERMKRELDIYVREGVDAVIVEDYFGTYGDMRRALAYIQETKPDIVYGVNCLNIDAMGFELAMEFDAAFVQLDSVVGHVKPRDEEALAAFLELYRSRYTGCVLGGVRFKYQPVLSERSLEEDLAIARGRCDAVAVTQDATGQETSLDKIRAFRAGLGDFPLIVAAGVTPENLRESFKIADGAVVGSYLKDTHRDDGELSAAHVREFMDAVRRVREECA